MNLYKILFSHTAPKDSKEGIKTYVLFKNESDVFNFIDETFEYNGWSERNDNGDVFEIFDDSFNVIGNENFCEKIIRIKGEMFDDDYDYSDAYYGITLYGWELVKEDITNNEITTLENLGILYKKEGI